MEESIPGGYLTTRLGLAQQSVARGENFLEAGQFLKVKSRHFAQHEVEVASSDGRGAANQFEVVRGEEAERHAAQKIGKLCHFVVLEGRFFLPLALVALPAEAQVAPMLEVGAEIALDEAAGLRPAAKLVFSTGSKRAGGGEEV